MTRTTGPWTYEKLQEQTLHYLSIDEVLRLSRISCQPPGFCWKSYIKR
uniref:Uncharacterized protein n=1 Tax=Lepeophtheirus salmonis TaxID=72036 RepID=A0A0K2VBF6_LEPSM